jgi:hypothetical protein
VFQKNSLLLQEGGVISLNLYLFGVPVFLSGRVSGSVSQFGLQEVGIDMGSDYQLSGVFLFGFKSATRD